jgi:hypothetical protein
LAVEQQLVSSLIVLEDLAAQREKGTSSSTVGSAAGSTSIADQHQNNKKKVIVLPAVVFPNLVAVLFCHYIFFLCFSQPSFSVVYFSQVLIRSVTSWVHFINSNKIAINPS